MEARAAMTLHRGTGSHRAGRARVRAAWAIGCLLTALVTGPVVARDDASGDRAARRIERVWKLDRDFDGVISRAEFERWRGSRRHPDLFDQIDTDGDGEISREELEAWGGKGLEARDGGGRPVVSCEPDEGCGPVIRDLVYRELPGVDPKLLSLDVYRTRRRSPAPVMIWVHGGGWTGGDKASANGLAHKPAYFTARGFMFVAVNYRLTPRLRGGEPDPQRLMYPAHVEDVAAAIAWVKEHASEYGGDPDNLSLIGHSAGGAIVALLATNERFLGEHGLSLRDLRCVISLDIGGAYDLTRSAPRSRLFPYIFGEDPQVWKEASPVYHVAPGKGIPAFFVVTTKKSDRDRGWRLSTAFVDRLQEAGVRAELVVVEDLDHRGVNRAIGDPEDREITPRLNAFLDHCAGEDAGQEQAGRLPAGGDQAFPWPVPGTCARLDRPCLASWG